VLWFKKARNSESSR